MKSQTRTTPRGTQRRTRLVPHLLAIALTLAGWHTSSGHAASPAPQQRITSAQAAPAALRAGKTASGLKSVSPRQHADNLYRQAASLLQQGHASRGLRALRQALALLPHHHESRQALALLQASDGDLAGAVELLRQGLALVPGQRELSLTLARLQLIQHQAGPAYQTLSAEPPFSNPDDLELHDLLAVTLQRLGRHQEAVQHYLDCLRSDPDEPRWLIGRAISLQALGQPAQAALAYSRALELGALTPEQEAFVRGQLQDPAR